MLIVLYFILGCLMEGMSMIYLTLPLLYPVIQSMGVDPIWFGIFLVILIELAQITPPMGLNLFVLQGITGDPIGRVIKGCLPYFALLIIGLVIILFFPGIATWLPYLSAG